MILIMTKIEDEPEHCINKVENESEYDSQDSDSDSEIDMSGDIDLPALINHFFTNENGENICNVLTDIKKSIDTHNKLIYKLISGKTEKNK